jgi:tellurite methyltransferase
MERPIVEFGLGDDGDLVAILSCGHSQHVRHNPPFINRPWTATAAGRSGMIGKPLNCVRCDNFELPDHFIPYKRTTEFNEESVPAALRKDHSTKTGVWAKITVTRGKLLYRIPALGKETELSVDRLGIVLPEVLHNVEPLGSASFFVEFYKAPERDVQN